jgi:hypothetical protein
VCELDCKNPKVCLCACLMMSGGGGLCASHRNDLNTCLAISGAFPRVGKAHMLRTRCVRAKHGLLNVVDDMHHQAVQLSV